jgi:hypothetical protein
MKATIQNSTESDSLELDTDPTRGYSTEWKAIPFLIIIIIIKLVYIHFDGSM